LREKSFSSLADRVDLGLRWLAGLESAEQSWQFVHATRTNWRAPGLIFWYEEFGYKTFVCDITDRNQVLHMVNSVSGQLGTIEILVNNAGIIKVGPFVDMTSMTFIRR
jgi:NADP-dependent 3-hydroxy acid dehydrogenase YdfG